MNFNIFKDSKIVQNTTETTTTTIPDQVSTVNTSLYNYTKLEMRKTTKDMLGKIH